MLRGFRKRASHDYKKKGARFVPIGVKSSGPANSTLSIYPNTHMKAIVLQTLDGTQHIGFILCAIPPGDVEGDCMFSIVPDNAELLEDPEIVLLLDRRDQGESQVELSEDSRSLLIRSHRLDTMFVQFENDGIGRWGYIRSGERVAIGQASKITSQH